MIEAERLHVTYELARDHLAASLLKARLHDLACAQLAQALGAAFEPYIKSDDPSVWLVRRLDVDVGLNAEANDDEVVGGWARQLSTSLSHKLDPQDPDVVRFDDRNHCRYIGIFWQEGTDIYDVPLNDRTLLPL